MANPRKTSRQNRSPGTRSGCLRSVRITRSVRKDAVRRISIRVHGSIRRLNKAFATTPDTPQRVAAPITARYPRSRSRNEGVHREEESGEHVRSRRFAEGHHAAGGIGDAGGGAGGQTGDEAVPR